MSGAGLRHRALEGRGEAWEAAAELLTAWLRDTSGEREAARGAVVSDDGLGAVSIAARLDPERLSGWSLDQLAMRAARRGALAAGLAPGFVVLDDDVAEELDRRADSRLLRRLLGSRSKDAWIETAVRDAAAARELLARPPLAARAARARTSTRLARGALDRSDLRRAAGRLDRGRPELWDAVLGAPSFVVAVLDPVSRRAWRRRLHGLAEQRDPDTVWLLEADGEPSITSGCTLDHPAVQELEQLAAALEDPSDALAVVAVLRGRMFGLADDVLERHRLAGGSWRPRRSAQGSVCAGDPAVVDALDQLARWGELAREAGVARAVETACRYLDHERLLRGLPHGDAEAYALRDALDHLHGLEIACPGDQRSRAEVLEALRRREGGCAGPARYAGAAAPRETTTSPRLRLRDFTTATVTGRAEVSESDFDLRVARHAMEQLLHPSGETEPGSASDLVERILSLTGRGREDAMRAGGLVRGLWSHPLLERARAAPQARTALDVAWVERPPGTADTEVSVVRGVIDLWFEDREGRVLVLCDSGPWREEVGRRGRIDARRRDFERLAEHLPGVFEAEERWVLLLGGPEVDAARIDRSDSPGRESAASGRLRGPEADG